MSGWLQAIAGYWRDGGWLLVPIALVASGVWAIILHLSRWLDDARNAAATTERRLEDWLRGSIQRDALLAELDRTGAFPGRLAAAALRDHRDAAGARRSFDGAGAGTLKAVRTNLLLLRALTGAAPLLGLLGTVGGMVRTFAAVSLQGAEGPTLVAGGISEALITTQFGLIAALPGMFGSIQINRCVGNLHSRLDAIGLRIRIATAEGGAPC